MMRQRLSPRGRVVGAEAPVEQKSAAQLVHNGAFALEMHVLHILGFAGGHVFVRYVHAAGKGNAVADQHFAVVAQVDAEIGREQARRHEQGHAHAAFGKFFPRLAKGIEHADAVHQQAGVHAALCSARQSIAKGRGNLTSIENIGAQKNVILGLLDGLKHGGIGLVAVAQGGYGIADAQMLLCEHASYVLHAGDAVGHVFWRNLGQGGMGVVRLQRLLPPHDAAGSALGPADAKTGVEDWPHNRQKQGGDSPAQGSAGIVFGQQRVAHRNPRKHMGDNEAQCFKK